MKTGHPSTAALRRRAALVAILLLAGGARAAPAAEASQPTTAADLKGATTLDVDRYRPSVPVAGCGGPRLPAGRPDARLGGAIAAARAYSDAKGGLALLVLRNGALVHESYAPGVTADRPLVTASMAKTVLALMIGIAIERKLIASVDDPLATYLTEWAGDPRGRITVRQALQMASGLAPSDFQAVLFGPDVGSAALRTPLAGDPGAAFGYNNAVSQLLLLALERQLRSAGIDGYPAFLASALWCPLGNGPASLWVDAGGLARGYAGLNAGARDWARIGELIRRRGASGKRRLVPKRWIAAMTEPSPANRQYGYQIWLGSEWTPQRRYAPTNPVTVAHGEPFLAPDIAYLDGFGGQRVYVIPSHGLTIVRLGAVRMDWDDAVIPNLLVGAAQ